MRVCPECGTAHRRGTRRRARYCSEKCRNNAEHRRARKRKREAALAAETICKHCGGTYLRGSGFPKYCSVQCRNRAGSTRGNQKRRAAKYAVHSEPVDFLEVFQRDGGACQHCGRLTPADLRGTKEHRAPELDHIIPLSRGGVDAPFNMQILCARCNVTKGNDLTEKDLQKAAALWPDFGVHVKRREAERRGRVPYRGVIQSAGKYRARIWHEGRYQYLGDFDTAEEAAIIYNIHAAHLKGPNAILNEVQL